MTDSKTGSDLAQRVLASRRGLMCGLAGLGAAGALAACGTAESPSSDPTSGSDDATTGGSEGSTGDAGGGTAIAATADVPEGGGIVVEDTVLVQPSADEFLAFSAACPHMGTTVNPPDADGVIVCPNHGSQFSLEGELEQGPAETGLAPVEITVEDGQIFLA
ncbi:Ferredoxin subunit of nitrite reductase or a ring-hydroxylating dioxygenase [Glycomyces sambucus]|uniref:Cytochrome bc1 complex Rieske iron-sulfur subunit n=1 Tax=Glycomyces sambucus TaxID=380244 RepID=A0A1G9H3U8_9ACTN|nr:Rieske (2Fe-2S) protein [Glycomyces sambucus]SDL07592.1 Ferredoxin subunit of nitrite reductase or a ring-hydroxylating dioxygenase [Glycomyces sambucus]